MTLFVKGGLGRLPLATLTIKTYSYDSPFFSVERVRLLEAGRVVRLDFIK
ncbi:hypothetical protein TDIS_1298 [Thermosulfurimonas dismutans]|uniref:Uncharacterized protein n=1 Tax=Thermosulfurimonas dismutans TaxID=999894 RepID=A0A179D3X4_9BACT|nr:hypothetical protein TDIS_1298 [Thermosulfurimonas dismutans]